MMQYRSSRGAIIAWRQAAPPNVAATVKRRKAQQVETRGTGHINLFGTLPNPPNTSVVINLTQVTASVTLGTLTALSPQTVAPRRQYSVRTRGTHVKVQGRPQSGATAVASIKQVKVAVALGTVTVSTVNGFYQVVRGGISSAGQRVAGADL